MDATAFVAALKAAKEVLDKTEVFITLPQETNRLMDSLWIQLKK